MKYDTQDINSVGELIARLEDHVNNFHGPVWFRGQANTTWTLEPKLMRIEPMPSESYFLNRFKQDASIILGHSPKMSLSGYFLCNTMVSLPDYLTGLRVH